MKYTKLRKHLLSLRYLYFALGLCGIVIAALASCPAPTRAALKSVAPGLAKDKDHEFLPMVDATIFDQSPFDGVGDGVGEDLGNTVFLTSGIGEGRGAMEFDLSAINPHRIQGAFLRIVPHGKAVLPGTLTIPVQLFGYTGDGFLQTDDFNVGCFITVFDGLAAPLNVPISLDVTEFLRGIRQANQPFVGFNLRTNVHGAQINFGSLELGTPPTLIVTLK